MQVELLGLVLLQPDRTWTLDALSKLLKAPRASIHRELQRAVNAGIIRRDSSVRPHAYEAAVESPLYPSLRDLLALTVGVEGELRHMLETSPGVVAAAVHGSWASGRVEPTSDIDLLIITTGDRAAVHRKAREIGRRIRRDIDASVMSPADFRELVHEENPFLQGIISGPTVSLIGDLAELARDG